MSIVQTVAPDRANGKVAQVYHGARNAAMNIMLEALKVENDF